MDDDLIRKNPFGFQLATVVVNDSIMREAITRKQERAFLDFVKNDNHFSKDYEGIYILFKTGLRISEFTGLTISDVDLKKKTLKVMNQLRRKRNMEYIIVEPKTEAGKWVIPVTDDVCQCFIQIIKNRKRPKVEPMVDGKVTPHVCRHIYCSNMVRSGINPKTLQDLMEHSDISVTMDTYTHLGFEDAQEELQRVGLL